jgi:two-component system, chemotaxis family, sensor kinase CheA
MARRVNGISGMIERVIRESETVTLKDVSELAKIFGCLERISDGLQDVNHDATELAQLLTLVVGRVINGAGQASLDMIKKGVLALQVSYLNVDGKTDLVDQELIAELQSFVDLAHDVPDLDEGLDDDALHPAGEEEGGASKQSSVSDADRDDIDWKSVPDVDLGALERKVAQEQLAEVLQDDKQEANRDDTDDQLAVEAQEIRTELSKTGYVVFDQDIDASAPASETPTLDGEGSDVEEDFEDPKKEKDTRAEKQESNHLENIAALTDEDDLTDAQDDETTVAPDSSEDALGTSNENSLEEDDLEAVIEQPVLVETQDESSADLTDAQDDETTVVPDSSEDALGTSNENSLEEDDLEAVIEQPVLVETQDESSADLTDAQDDETTVAPDSSEDALGTSNENSLEEDDLEAVIEQPVLVETQDESSADLTDAQDDETTVAPDSSEDALGTSNENGLEEDDLEAVIEQPVLVETQDESSADLTDAQDDETTVAPDSSEGTSDVSNEGGLNVLTDAITSFLEDESEIQMVDSETLESTVLIDKDDEPNLIEDETIETDTFWVDAEPTSKPDLEVSQMSEPSEPVVDEDDILAQIALNAMTLDLDDMSGLGRVHTQLETLASECENRPLFVKLTRGLTAIIEKIILFECDDVEDPLSLICEGVTVLQQMDQDVDRGVEERFTNEALVAQVMAVAQIDMADLGDSSEGETVEDDSGSTGGEKLEPIDVDQDIFFDFSSEAGEHLETAGSKLLELESHSEDKEVINAVFRSFHTIKGASSFLNLEDVTRVAHSIEDILDSARKGSLALTPSILDVALESLDLLAELIDQTKEALENGKPVYAQDVTGFLQKVERAVKGEPTLENEPAIPQTPVVEKAVHENAVQTGGVAANPEPTPEARASNREQSYVRVGTEKLDQLVNLVGELVIAQTQVSQSPDVENSDNQKLTKDISQLMKISTDIQEISMSMRMVPIRSTFERMARIVRDLSRKCGKQVRFEVSGEDTELDKNVVEELVDPLTHMVRNAVDHGIEPEDDRETMGKPNQGAVHLNAYHKGGNIVIELRDDGKGLDRDKIMKKAIERGLVQPDAQMSDEEVFLLVFQAGFSTAEQISDISGRGVGMDVVRRNIEGLRGRVEVTSELGKGSTFTIRLPLTLAIIDGMVIGVGQERYILPLTAIVRSLRPEKEDVFYVMGKGEMIRVQEELLPVVRLYNRFGVRPTCTDIWESLVVVVEAEGKRCGIMVDELLGMQQVVIKGLHDHLRKEPCLSGCAILGDGRVGLILDANGLVREGNKTGKIREGKGEAYRSAS